ncbi:MAG: murein biosynthesis integral membrane protein MurJ [Candidatus Falkowbacteria bacterium]
MLKNLFGRQTNSITMAAALVGVSSLLSRFLGVFRDRILAGQFGAGQSLDIYYSAFRIPDLIYSLIILGALSAGFIPVFTGLVKDFKSYKSTGLFKYLNSEAWDLVNNLLNVLMLSLISLSLLGIIFAPSLISLISPGFSPEAQKTTADLTRIMFLSPLFLGISGILGGILQSFKNFLVYSIAPIMYNVGIILGALWLSPSMGISGLAWGVVLGAFLHMAVQIPVVYNLGWRYRLFVDFKNKNLIRIARMMIPRTLSLAISQVNLVIITIIASNLASGSLTVFNFANNLQSFPIGIFGISFAVAAFPALSAAARDNKKMIGHFSLATRQILFFIIPATILLITLRAQIIRIILGTGSFDWNDTILTMDTLGFFALSLFAQAIIPLQTRVFYARQDSRTPFFIGIFVVIANIFLSIWLSGRLGVAGLALAFSMSSILNFVMLWAWLHVRVGSLDQGKILISTAKFSAAGIAAGFVVQLMKDVVWPYINMSTFSGVLVQGLVAAMGGIITYLAVCAMLRSEEFYDFLNLIKRKLSWRKIKVGDQGEVRGL